MIDGVEPRAIDRLQPREILQQQIVSAKELILPQNRVAATL